MIPILDTDRVLFVAPHPDDESLGAGGLLQRAFEARIPVRILFATNGDNNPWAQRFWERRWRIREGDRTRWGGRRQKEALSAIAEIGGPHECARFLNFKDQSITSMLMRGSPELPAALEAEIRAFRPTVAVIPSILDAHPDHSALCVALTLSLDSLDTDGLRIWEYLIHRPPAGVARRAIVLRLTPVQVEKKRAAILCHRTQVKLSGNRFLRFARTEEPFYAHAAIDAESYARPVLRAQIGSDGVRLVMEARRRERLGAKMLLLVRFGGGRMQRIQIRIPFYSGKSRCLDLASGKRLPDAIAAWNGVYLTIEVPIIESREIDAFLVKYSSWKLFFDRSGWCQIVGSRKRSLNEMPYVPDVLTQS